jgi:hypothetical protein
MQTIWAEKGNRLPEWNGLKHPTVCVQVFVFESSFFIQAEKPPCVNVSDTDSLSPDSNQVFFYDKTFSEFRNENFFSFKIVIYSTVCHG